MDIPDQVKFYRSNNSDMNDPLEVRYRVGVKMFLDGKQYGGVAELTKEEYEKVRSLPLTALDVIGRAILDMYRRGRE